MDKPKCWFKNVMKKFTVESESWSYTFIPNIWVCPYFSQIWVETTQHFI